MNTQIIFLDKKWHETVVGKKKVELIVYRSWRFSFHVTLKYLLIFLIINSFFKIIMQTKIKKYLFAAFKWTHSYILHRFFDVNSCFLLSRREILVIRRPHTKQQKLNLNFFFCKFMGLVEQTFMKNTLTHDHVVMIVCYTTIFSIYF